MNLLILNGTGHNDSQTSKVANHLNNYLSQKGGLEVNLFDLHKVKMKIQDEASIEIADYKQAVLAADALLIVSPEYNHTFPGSLKMVMDTLYDEYKHRAVGFCGVSSGIFGGSRVVEQLVAYTRVIGLVPTQSALFVANVKEMFNEAGEPTDEKFNGRIDKYVDGELLWLARALAAERNK